jgi:hypothetical protein
MCSDSSEGDKVTLYLLTSVQISEKLSEIIPEIYKRVLNHFNSLSEWSMPDPHVTLYARDWV